MNKNEPEDLAEILESLRMSTNLGQQLEEARIWERWPEIVGPHLMPHGRPIGVREGTLFIEVESAVWMHKYSYDKSKIVANINELAHKKWVSEIYLRLTPDEVDADPQDGV